jgi:hypothetical protein
VRPSSALGASLLLVAACITIAAPSDPARYYLLEPEASPAEAARPVLPAFGVGPVRLPAYLDRREIVTRAGPGRLELSGADRWAAPLDLLFIGVLAEDLRAALPAREVSNWPWPLATSPDWSVSVDVQRFDGEPDGTAVLEARWTLRRGGAVATQGATVARERRAAPGLAGTVAALGKTIGVLSRDIAAAVDASARGTPSGAVTR